MSNKIFRRATLSDGSGDHIYTDDRRRDVTIAFRVTKAERDLINARIYASGLEKADFLIESCLFNKILVKGNIRSFTHIRHEVAVIVDLLQKDPTLDNLSAEHIEGLRTILQVLENRFSKIKHQERPNE